jgi:hypothetical protein
VINVTDMTMIEIGLPPETAEAVQEVARMTHMTLPEYVRELIEADLARKSAENRGLLLEGEVSTPVTDDVLADIAEFRSGVRSKVTTADILTALEEGRRM